MVHLSEISLLRSKKSRAELSKWKNQHVLFLGLILADVILQQTNPLRLSSAFLLHRLLGDRDQWSALAAPVDYLLPLTL